MNSIKYLFLNLAVSLLIFYSCKNKEEDSVSFLIEEVREEYAPDKRVAIFDIEWNEGQLNGETNLPEAFDQLRLKLNQLGVDYKEEVNLLPELALGDQHHALVTLSVANLRSQPKHSAELATQALMGTPLKVLKKENSWYLVQTPDLYISWVDAAGIQIMDQANMEKWTYAEKIVCTELLSHVYESPSEKVKVSDLAAGNMLEVLDAEGDQFRVKLPDGRTGFIQKSDATPLKDWLATRNPSDNNLIHTAKNMMGVPYLWGGTSPKGVDCSGFTKTIYFLNGMVIPRDASQQVLEGEEVDTDKNWENLEVGDLLFFGTPSQNGSPEKVVHVGMWIGNNSFIHSRGRVRISSFDPGDINYDESELNRYLRSKRIRNSSTGNLFLVDGLVK